MGAPYENEDLAAEHAALIDPTFKAEVVWPTGSLIFARQLGDRSAEAFGDGLQNPLLASTPLADVEWATLQTYMHRRFGPGNMGNENNDDLCAGWLLSTPIDGVLLRVWPSFDDDMFELLVPMDRDEFRYRKNNGIADLDDAALKRHAHAYRTALLDLLRPVPVRDSHFNVLGEVGDSIDCFLEEDGSLRTIKDLTAEASKASNVALPKGMLDSGIGWHAIIKEMNLLGSGSTALGAKKTLDLIKVPEFRAPDTEPRVVPLPDMSGLEDDVCDMLAAMALQIDTKARDHHEQNAIAQSIFGPLERIAGLADFDTSMLEAREGGANGRADAFWQAAKKNANPGIRAWAAIIDGSPNKYGLIEYFAVATAQSLMAAQQEAGASPSPGR